MSDFIDCLETLEKESYKTPLCKILLEITQVNDKNGINYGSQSKPHLDKTSLDITSPDKTSP
jgi:hypothetical protein